MVPALVLSILAAIMPREVLEATVVTVVQVDRVVKAVLAVMEDQGEQQLVRVTQAALVVMLELTVGEALEA